MKKLWIFGTSHCLAFNITGPGWADLLGTKLNATVINTAQPAADNFFIYHCYLENLSLIKTDDIVVIGWSHYSRKSFVEDLDNLNQQKVKPSSYVYQTKTHTFIRSKNAPGTIGQFLDLKPKNTNREYYDVWFNNYYSSHEQTCNQQSYMDSVELTCPGVYIPFFFSKESVENLRTPTTHAGYIVEFINNNNLMISKDDGHLNSIGHHLWADNILKYIDTQV